MTLHLCSCNHRKKVKLDPVLMVTPFADVLAARRQGTVAAPTAPTQQLDGKPILDAN